MLTYIYLLLVDIQSGVLEPWLGAIFSAIPEHSFPGMHLISLPYKFALHHDFKFVIFILQAKS